MSTSLVMKACQAAGNFLLPKICLGCQRPGSDWCQQCDLAVGDQAFWARQHHGVPIFAITYYRGPVVRLVNLAKEANSPIAQSILAKKLASCLRVALDQTVADSHDKQANLTYVVPIPTTRRARRVRGGDPWAHVARKATSLTNRPVAFSGGLENSRARSDQSNLSSLERQTNVSDSFIWRDVFAHQIEQVILVDDVVTTGATLTAAADAIRKAGSCVMACAVIASTQRRVRKEVAIYTENTRPRSYQPL